MSADLPPEQPHEYPKHIEVGGITVEVTSREDELRWLAAAPPPEPVPDVLDDPDGVPPSEEPSDPLDDVSLKMDNPSFHSTSTAKKKK